MGPDRPRAGAGRIRIDPAHRRLGRIAGDVRRIPPCVPRRGVPASLARVRRAHRRRGHDARLRRRNGPRRPVDVRRFGDRGDDPAPPAGVVPRGRLPHPAGRRRSCRRGGDLQGACDGSDLRARGAVQGPDGSTHAAPGTRRQRVGLPHVRRVHEHRSDLPRRQRRAHGVAVQLHRPARGGPRRRRLRDRSAALLETDPYRQGLHAAARSSPGSPLPAGSSR